MTLDDSFNWRLLGNCNTADAELFYGPDADPVTLPRGEHWAHKRDREAEAKAICQGCPFSSQCEAEGLASARPDDHGNIRVFGVWGGKGEAELSAIAEKLEEERQKAKRAEFEARIVSLDAQGLTRAEIASALHTSKQMVRRVLGPSKRDHRGTAARRAELTVKAAEMAARGMNHWKISKALGVDNETVTKYLSEVAA